MGQHQFSIARRRRLYAGAFVGLGVAVAAIACGHLESETGNPGGSSSSSSSSGVSTGSGSGSASNSSSSGQTTSSGSGPSSSSSSGSAVVVVDGAPPDSGKVACGSSSEKLPYSTGTPAGTDSSARQPDSRDLTTLVNAMDQTHLANQMRGTSPTNGGTPPMENDNDIFRTPDDTDNNVKGFLFRDGPRGNNLIAGQYSGSVTAPIAVSYGNGYVTAFPVPAARAASWDLDLESKIGADMGDETLASGNTMILAPCINILRHPAWGRAQETYGEDSFQLGRLGSAYTIGVQQYIPACAKHFAANNIEAGRETQNAQMDEQTLHEIYGRHFEMVVQDANVSCVMAAYNLVNGTKSTENVELISTMLKGTFAFKGFVLSDWWAMPPRNAPENTSDQAHNAMLGIAAGLDMELPWSYNYSQLGNVANLQQLQASAKAIVQQKLRFNVAKTGVATQSLGLRAPTTSLGANGIQNNDAHIADAEQAAEEGMVLLQNNNNTLPIQRSKVHTVAVIGASVPWTLTGTMQMGTVNFATDVRLGDLGSSRVSSDPGKSVGPAAGIQAAAGSGITVMSGTSASLASQADVVVVVAGMTPADEGEGYTTLPGPADRSDSAGNAKLGLDGKSGTNAQNNLIMSVAQAGKPTIVVLEGGSAIDMPWLSSVGAVVMAWYPGMTGGTALGKLLFGDVNFSGKLPISWPKSESDLPMFNSGGTAGGTTTMDYYLGYRYYDHSNIKPLFAFGYGMSYTSFKYQYLQVPCSTVTQSSVVDVAVGITNTGSVAGTDIAFLFVSYPNTTARRSIKELKGFFRTPVIMPGSTVQVTIPLRVSDLKYWNTGSNGWTVESGKVNVMVGPSSDNLPLTDSFTVQ